MALSALILITGCKDDIRYLMNPDEQPVEVKIREKVEEPPLQTYYDTFFKEQAGRGKVEFGTKEIEALDALPKDAFGQVDWTAAVVKGYINPRPSLDASVEDEPPLDLNIFIEAKVPLMANVIFPHSIHTYWLSCNNCHPKIFLPEAGANPISMDEIFQGKWCGRCHGKVAFPLTDCTRCHTSPKSASK